MQSLQIESINEKIKKKQKKFQIKKYNNKNENSDLRIHQKTEQPEKIGGFKKNHLRIIQAERHKNKSKEK